ncbi:sigma-54-dependent Fis family transcriptional regulator [Leeia sp. TBRC 13508]|uniref:Sigma-54-dependent Fis family transcriptional regulator n=1 Tax=Leeia speluncae TaxID=2884804 RepID=A0ABS8D6F4_9NEIS|nr:sigma-54-dependent Fis family transcriptional regulator [Leeia speluncae]MCB6183779.1 sigma-54-dependent Fis family transcriptional regulator [Leeia speluncae]
MSLTGTPSANAIKKARYQFFEKGELPPFLPISIARSWQRCAALGINSHLSNSEPVTRYELDIAKERSTYLLKLAEPELDVLGASVADSGSMILLTDADGLILDRRGEGTFLRKAEQVALKPGVNWSETDKGTNAIGTALAEKSMVEVWGGEHYLHPNQVLSCTAAPILTPQGELAGVLDISGDARLPQGHAKGLIQMAIRQIEHRWFLELAEQHAHIRFHTNPTLLGTPQEALIICNDNQILFANRVAKQTLNLEQQDEGVALNTLFIRVPTQSEIVQIIQLKNGQQYSAIVRTAQPKTKTIPTPAPVTRPAPAGIYWDNASQHQLSKATRAINAEIPVLILGETGTGKEIFSRALHAACSRRDKPFIAINCAAIPEGLIEAELFGYEEGAFTGARKKGAPGKLKEADGGVLFLDEIGDMPLSLQARLLRVLQEKEVSPLGGGKATKVDFIPICATHKDLTEAVAQGTFRADLYYRLQHFVVNLTPLREREGLPDLLDTLFESSGAKKRNITLCDKARLQLLSYEWPGNARELANLLKTLVALADDQTQIITSDLPVYIQNFNPYKQQISNEVSGLNTVTDNAIEEALAKYDGNISAAAKALGIHRSTIYRNIKRKNAT